MGKHINFQLKAPLVIGGMGGSGTRVYQEIAKAAGYTMLVAPSPVRKLKKEQHDNYLLKKYFYARWVNRYLAGELRRAATVQMRIELQTMLALSDPKHYGRNLWGWKNPRTIYLLPFLNDIYPSMHYIHVIRDGRDHAFHPRFSYEHNVLLSSKDRYVDESVRKALIWSKTNLLGQQAGTTFLRGRYIQSRLEDLCANPISEVERILDFLGRQDSLAVQETAQYISKPSSLMRWRKQPVEDIAVVERAIGEHLEHYGYTLHTG